MVQTMPMSRPRLEDLLAGISYVLAEKLEPRGTVTFEENKLAAE